MWGMSKYFVTTKKTLPWSLFCSVSLNVPLLTSGYFLGQQLKIAIFSKQKQARVSSILYYYLSTLARSEDEVYEKIFPSFLLLMLMWQRAGTSQGLAKNFQGKRKEICPSWWTRYTGLGSCTVNRQVARSPLRFREAWMSSPPAALGTVWARWCLQCLPDWHGWAFCRHLWQPVRLSSKGMTRTSWATRIRIPH